MDFATEAGKIFELITRASPSGVTSGAHFLGKYVCLWKISGGIIDIYNRFVRFQPGNLC